MQRRGLFKAHLETPPSSRVLCLLRPSRRDSLEREGSRRPAQGEGVLSGRDTVAVPNSYDRDLSGENEGDHLFRPTEARLALAG